MNIKKVNILIPPTWSGVYINVARLLTYSLNDIGIAATIVEIDAQYKTDLTIVLGWHLFPATTIQQPYIIYQLEPMMFRMWQEKLQDKLSLFKNAHAIWDYSCTNKPYLIEHGLTGHHMPVGYHEKLNEKSPSPYFDFDVLFVGFITERRKAVIDALMPQCCVSVQPQWGQDFTNVLSRTKIFLNIHQYDVATPIEQPRIAYALNNESFVITEESADQPYQKLVTASYDDLVQTCLHYLHSSHQRLSATKESVDHFKTLSMKDLLDEWISMQV